MTAPPPDLVPLRPLHVPTERIIIVGIAVWVLALVVVLVVPSLHQDDRSWWPWACLGGIVLGLLGYTYTRRGRGNASGAE